MKKFISGYLAFCTNHGQARCHSKMACKNDSSQVKACLNHPDVIGESRAGSSRETTDGSSPKRRHSQSSGNEATGSRQKPGAEARSGDTWGEGKLKSEPECHMQLDKLFANRQHTVLIDSPNAVESRWAGIERALKKLMHRGASVGDVEGAIKMYNPAHSMDWSFEALYTYVEKISKLENNFSNLISKMAKLALKLPELIQHPIPLLRQNCSHAITMSQEQISCLLANAFFCTFPHRNTRHAGSEYGNFPTINFSSLFAVRSPGTLEKLRALFHYFNTVTEEATKPIGLVTFERICIPPSQWPEWNKRMENMTNLHVCSKGFIEKEGKGMLQVDFASKFVGGGVLGRGLVQEEIRFIQCPELIVARLFTEKLADNECLKITGAQMYSNTAGYSDNFEWHSPHTDSTERDEWKRHYCQIVAIDALKFDDPRQQFTEKNIKRELLKAYVGFRKDPNIPTDYTPAVATGNWGCGAFKGDPMLKALIQMMAAAVAQRDLAYFTFENKKQAEDLQRMHALLKGHKMTVGKLYNLLQDYCKHYSHHHHKAKNVFDYISEKMGVRASQL
ncbi:hypothetical protein PDJAM_G00080580 [Pangasius djambal]|uniref:Uncharacterized protein n=1 Tax=Pangasius djambal TaxID=1691987 RepID=A0ACC5Z373_9TELE|nr:hypothetical protein [Pangasius djambal]